MIKIIIELIIIVVAWFVLVSFFAFYTSIHPKKILNSQTPQNLGLVFENVAFQTEDGLTLKGWFVPAKESSNKTIIILHGYPAEKGDVLSWAIFLHDQYNLIFFDFRYFGESEGGYTTIGWKEQKDLKAAVEYLKTRNDVDPQRIGVMGFSLGGAVAIMGSKDIPEIKAQVADSPFSSLDEMAEMLYKKFSILKRPLIWSTKQWTKLILKFDFSQVSPFEAAEVIKTPLLLIHGNQDQQIPIENSRKIFSVAKDSAELWEVDGADHGEAYFQEKELYEKKVLEFFEKWLK